MDRPAADHLPTSFDVRPFASGLGVAARRAPKVTVTTWQVDVTRPEVATVNIKAPDIRVSRFQFPQSAWMGLAVASPASVATTQVDEERIARTTSRRAARPDRGPGVGRIKPTSDTIKLADRLFYLLQPPVESWLCAESRAAVRALFLSMGWHCVSVSAVSAILADEMGLGKTMQAITTMRMLLHSGEIRSALLICPKPLVTNWQRELKQWAPELPYAVIEGRQSRRNWQWQLNDVPLKIANYELLLRDRDAVTASANDFDLVVLDEAQRIKNRSSSTSQIVRAIQRKRSWALTGTPIENSSDDLLGIFEFLSPGYLSASMTPRRMGKAAADYILRRTKKKVLTDLPPILYRDALVQLTPEQDEAYQLAESDGVLRLSNLGASLTIQHVFELVLRLKQICNFDPVSGTSSKCERLVADMEEIANSGGKAIVFSQWVNTINQLSERLAPFGPLEFHGGVRSRARDAILEQFQHDDQKHVLLMSYGAGSVGLNLQFAGYVFLFDRWWNPAVEDQAINRAHRIGSAGPVTVTRYLVTGSIEERIDAVLRQKRELFHAILNEAEGRTQLGFSRAEVFSLVNLPDPKQTAAAGAA